MTGQNLTHRLADWHAATPFPQPDSSTYDLTKMFDTYTAKEKLRTQDVVALAKWVHAVLSNRMHTAYSAWEKQLRTYIATWRSQLLKQNQADKAEMGVLAENAAVQIRNIRQQKDAAIVNCKTNQDILTQTEKEIRNI